MSSVAVIGAIAGGWILLPAVAYLWGRRHGKRAAIRRAVTDRDIGIAFLLELGQAHGAKVEVTEFPR